MKRNQDLMKVLASKFEASEVDELLAQVELDFNAPNLKLHFPAASVDTAEQDDDIIEPIQKESHKRAMIQQHSLQVASLVPTFFAHCLTANHVQTCLSMLVTPAFAATKDDQAQFKLFGLVLTL